MPITRDSSCIKIQTMIFRTWNRAANPRFKVFMTLTKWKAVIW